MDLSAALELLLTYKYVLMLPLAIVEGPILMMVCGFFVKTGQLALLPTFLILSLGDLLGDALWYWWGHAYGHRFVRRWGRFLSLTEEHIAIVERIFHRYHIRILLLSKLTMGLGFPGATLFTAGLVRIPFSAFMLLNTVGQLIWTGLLMGAGYFLGQLYIDQVDSVFGLISTFGMMAAILVALFGFSRFLRARLTKTVS